MSLRLPSALASGCCITQQCQCSITHNLTAGVPWPQVAAAMQPFVFQQFGNPSSPHIYGQGTKAAMDGARQQVASLIGAEPGEVHFTACGTESDNWAIYGVVMAQRSKANGSIPHVVTTSIEHPAVIECLKHMAAQVRVTIVQGLGVTLRNAFT